MANSNQIGIYAGGYGDLCFGRLVDRLGLDQGLAEANNLTIRREFSDHQ